MKLWLGVLLLTLVLTAMLVEGEESEEVGSRPKREDICRRLYPGSCKKRDKLAQEADISSDVSIRKHGTCMGRVGERQRRLDVRNQRGMDEEYMNMYARIIGVYIVFASFHFSMAVVKIVSH